MYQMKGILYYYLFSMPLVYKLSLFNSICLNLVMKIVCKTYLKLLSVIIFVHNMIKVVEQIQLERVITQIKKIVFLNFVFQK